MIFFDSETCGFHGVMTLLQYAYDDGPVILHDVWCEPIIDTLVIFEELANHSGGVVGFNLSYDWFHVQKMTNCLRLLADRVGSDEIPRDHITTFTEIEPLARDGDCIKPVTALDLMLYARKGPYQSTMGRKAIRLRRVPKILAYELVEELEQRVPLKDIYFAKRANKNEPKWKIFPIVNKVTKREDENFVDIVLKFRPSSALKAIVIDAGLRRADTRLLFHQVDPGSKPIEIGWAPYAKAISSESRHWFAKVGSKKGFAWPSLIDEHIDHWRYNSLARQYASEDVSDLQLLYNHFGKPELGDTDSVLSCMVGSCRWRGYAIDVEAVKALRQEQIDRIKTVPRDPSRVYVYLSEVMSDIEKNILLDDNGNPTTAKVKLEAIEKEMVQDCTCVKYSDEASVDWSVDDLLNVNNKTFDPNCPICKGVGSLKHPAAIRAYEVLEARKGYNRKVLFDKLLQAGRFHASLSVIGSLSSRMSGSTEVSDGKKSSNLNPQGIPHEKKIRKAFTLAMPGHILNGGDYDAYEVSIAEARYNDPDLRKQLLTCNNCGYVCDLDEYQSEICTKCGEEDSRRKIHGLFAMELFPGNDYNTIIASKGTAFDMYDYGKRGLFGGVFYGGDENTLFKRLNIALDVGKEARDKFFNRYKGVGQAQQSCYDRFCSMRQPGGIGKRVEWHEPDEFVESLTGFKRWFSLENTISRHLFELAENPPEPWTKLKIQVVRRDREQNVGNAVRSAIFAAAFQIQAGVMRAALNHEIQSTGATLTKDLQAEIWKHQPYGVAKWMVQPLNIHDEVMCPSDPSIADDVESTVNTFNAGARSIVPLLKMSWKKGMKNWAEK